MTGLITIKGIKYVFRDDVDDVILAWEIHSDYSRGMTHKWGGLPEGPIELFDIDNPPRTVSYLPILNY
jgi:hypothetical protein